MRKPFAVWPRVHTDWLGTHAIMREAGVSKTVVWRWQDRFA
jgi:hypothetical protein